LTPGTQWASVPDEGFENWLHPDEKTFKTNTIYGASKTSNILMAKHFQTMMQAQGASVTAVSVHPGVGKTGLGKEGTSSVFQTIYAGASNMLLWS